MVSEASNLEELVEEPKKPEFRDFCIQLIRDEVKRINLTIPELKRTKAVYGKLKSKLILRSHDEDTALEVLEDHPQFVEAYDKFCEHWEALKAADEAAKAAAAEAPETETADKLLEPAMEAENESN